ncbi:hypothetical protein K7B10_40140 [Streptomyces flavotricini]|uniref:Uncharacterized protein n=1 Tax=Streptomyces flavotricini TaxID=66888 RepID=A0ABS8EI85_9ACTN|nr:hypothetical protein [Streptomyces flavotricini]MCC0100851.1 hypothetical protein [Streptomyces flavotricini]
MTALIDLPSCSDPDTALVIATNLLEPALRLRDNDFWHANALSLLSGYLLAAALGDNDVDTVFAWTADPENRRPLELLRGGPVPQWAQECEAILLPEETRNRVLFTALDALQGTTPHPA